MNEDEFFRPENFRWPRRVVQLSDWIEASVWRRLAFAVAFGGWLTVVYRLLGWLHWALFG